MPVFNRKSAAAILVAAASATFLASCREADIASQNISNEADSFRVLRRVVFYNGITNDYVLVIEGYCSLGNDDKPRRLSVTCKTGNSEYKKHFLGISDNVTFFAEQKDAIKVNGWHYKVVFRPQTILPDLEIRVNPSELPSLPRVTP